jgi:uncharacterized membrane protein YgdD (TMEM256/DUF423 family)
MTVSRCWIPIGALLAGLAVAAGAFGAHGLDQQFHAQYEGQKFVKKVVIDGQEKVVAQIPLAQKYLADFKTGAEYQMYHGLALILLGMISRNRPAKSLNVAGWCFVGGCLGFSGGLYAYTLTGIKGFGMTIVPLGGILFLAGWTTLAVATWRSRKASSPTEFEVSTIDIPPRS